MLDYSIEEIMTKLINSYAIEPINTISIDGKYYITTNGLHRFMALKLYYILEMYQGKSIQELDNKHMITVNNKDLNVFINKVLYLNYNHIEYELLELKQKFIIK